MKSTDGSSFSLCSPSLATAQLDSKHGTGNSQGGQTSAQGQAYQSGGRSSSGASGLTPASGSLESMAREVARLKELYGDSEESDTSGHEIRGF